MIYVYLSEAADGSVAPQWAALLAHLCRHDLRRRWDDPELERVGDHPVIYAGAGPHASPQEGGEYLAELGCLFWRWYGWWTAWKPFGAG